MLSIKRSDVKIFVSITIFKEKLTVTMRSLTKLWKV
jgi:hypothetical protein